MRFRDLVTLEKVLDDMRNWAVGLTMTGLLAVVIAVGLWVKKAFQQEPLPWTILIVLFVLAIVLFGVAIAVSRRDKTPIITEGRLLSEQPLMRSVAEKSSGEEPQPIFSAIDQLYALRDGGVRLLGKFQTDPHEDKPTLEQVIDFEKRTFAAARRNDLGLTPAQFAKFRRGCDQAEVLDAVVRMMHHGFLKDNPRDEAVYGRLWCRIKRLQELIKTLES